MAIPSNTKTPGVYTSINTQTQRTGLPAQDHKVLLLVSDDSAGVGSGDGGLETVATQAQADTLSGDKNSNLSRMTRAALATTLALSMQVASAGSTDLAGSPGNCSPGSFSFSRSEVFFSGETAYLQYSLNGEQDSIAVFQNTSGDDLSLAAVFLQLLADVEIQDGIPLVAFDGAGDRSAFRILDTVVDYKLIGNSSGPDPINTVESVESHTLVIKLLESHIADTGLDWARRAINETGSSLPATLNSCAIVFTPFLQS